MQQDDEIEDVVPSTASNEDEVTKVEQTEEVLAPAESSTAEGDDALLSVARDAVPAEEAAEEASPAEGEEQTEPEEAAERDEDDYSDVPFHQHKRFRELVQKVKTYRQDAENYRKVQTFIDESGLAPEEASEGLVIMGLMKTNPREAWVRMKPVIQNLLVAAGEIIPSELQQQVEAGALTREAAVELSRTKAELEAMRKAQEFEAIRRQQRAVATAQAELQGAAELWERDRKLKDPNFSAKEATLHREVAWLLREEKPQTPQEVKALLDRAYKTVNSSYRPPAPKPTKQAAPQAVSKASGANNSDPQSTLDVMKMALAKTRAGNT